MHEKLCCRDHTLKPVSEFRKNCRAKDGLNYHCKDCDYEIKYKRKRPPKEDIPLNQKRCIQCNTIKDLEEFHKDNGPKSCSKNVRSRCKECANKSKMIAPPGYKKCTKCGNILPLELFNWKEKGKRRCSRCKDCRREWYFAKNLHRKRRLKKASTASAKECSICHLVLNKKLYFSENKTNKDGFSIYCKECSSIQKKKSYEKIPLHVRQKKSRERYEANKKKTAFRLNKNLRNQFYKAIKRYALKKKHSVLDLVGCSTEYLIFYIESQFTPEMCWDNYGKYWSIDHIKPICCYNLEKISDQKACWHYSNLRPLSKLENLKKGARWNSYGSDVK